MPDVFYQNAENRAVQEMETSRPSARAATNSTCNVVTETQLLKNAAKTKFSLLQVGNAVS